MNSRDTQTTPRGRSMAGLKASAILFWAGMVFAPIVRSHAVTTVCSLHSSLAPQQPVIAPITDVGDLNQAPALAVIDHYAEALGYSKTIRQVEIANQDNEVGVTIYMPAICTD